ncbi:SDR family NAD(P)-dependent oxidoreductase [Cellulophaga sp. BC115SP]|jgi:NAD(P)-dependent dehydrogenase (short-subunit alcohol dehydrogenase family)|uniref:SDR family NAD(P)-dependent oxidoreductase n=1 Tax=Cellulophaga sp. BC115SP TaxID=2683263 RepID=UPI00141320DE|nr:SDR family NAD(P)-dependent oxidoreductase [Cellulophaga sp. BC115SP]NBB29548.1 SDR family oxidoreductase [Cellulophaga sp. BC115SP]
MKKLENKVAIITGGAGSIGKITAKLFMEEGAKVFLVDTNEPELQKIEDELGGVRIRYCVADVSNSDDTHRYVMEALNEFGGIDIFFNNAGVEGVVQSIIDYPEAVFDRVMEVNVRGTWLGIKYVVPHMNNGGSIIISSSVAGLTGFVNLSAYVASKHAIVGIMKVTALEVAHRNIRVNAIHPSPVNNRMMRSIEEGTSVNNSGDVKRLFEARIPMKRYAEPIEVASLAMFLASDDSQFITGTSQVIDGGLLAG